MGYLVCVKMWYELGLVEYVYESMDQTENECWHVYDSVFEKIGDAEMICGRDFESAFVKVDNKWYERIYELTDNDMGLTGKHKDYFQYECDKYAV